MILHHDTEKYRGVSNPPFTKIMNRTVTQQAKEFYANWRRTVKRTVPNYLRPSEYNYQGTFYFKNAWRQVEDSGKAHTKRPLNLWADAHTISVADDTITITRDENNQVSTAGDRTPSNITKIFAASDFNFADTDGDSLSKINITTLESAGVLEYSSNGSSWADVTLNQEITA